MRVCLIEDVAVAQLEPLTLTRPAFDLLCGLSSLGSKQGRYFAADSLGVFIRPGLADVYRQRQPAVSVNDPSACATGPVAVVNARWLPPPRAEVPAPAADGPCCGVTDDDVAWMVVDGADLAGLTLADLPARLGEWKRTLPRRPAGGKMVNRLWDLIAWNGEQIERDFRALADLPHAGHRPAGLQLVGPSDRLLLDPTAQLDPLVVADTRGGPVVVARDAVVTAFSRLEGPCFVGPGTQVFGAKVRAGTTLGPHSRIGGEVEASIVQGFSNKYHDGFLGHSYVGEWVNLGAGTQTSDLRLDYGTVSVRLHGGSVATGSPKVGSFVGDHVKTGLGTLLNSGTVAGPFAQLLPNGRLLPRDLPAFARCGPHGLADLTDLEELFAIASTVMQRRGHAFTPAHRALYQAVHGQTAAWRRSAAAVAETRLRRSA